MKIHVQLFAALREAAGAGQLEVEAPAETTPRKIAYTLAERFPKFRAHLPTLSFAVNDEIVAPDFPITTSSEVALLPPVSGG